MKSNKWAASLAWHWRLGWLHHIIIKAALECTVFIAHQMALTWSTWGSVLYVFWYNRCTCHSSNPTASSTLQPKCCRICTTQRNFEHHMFDPVCWISTSLYRRQRTVVQAYYSVWVFHQLTFKLRLIKLFAIWPGNMTRTIVHTNPTECRAIFSWVLIDSTAVRTCYIAE